MDIKKMLITAAVSILADKGIIAKPDSMTAFISNLFGEETAEQKMVRELDAATDKMIEAAKKMNTNRKFKKVTKDF
jgi:hypothetical protein